MGFFEKRSTAEIEKENAKLRAMAEVRRRRAEAIAESKRQRANASRENFNLKHGKKVTYVKKAGSGLGWVAKGVGSGLMAVGEQYAKAQESKRPQPKRKRRVKKVKKVKRSNRPKNSFTITYN